MQPASSGRSSQQEPLFDGSWEQSGRSLNSAAVLTLVGIGALYFNVQSFLGAFLVIVTSAFRNVTPLPGDFFDRMTEEMRLLAQPVRVIVAITQYFFLLLPALWIVRRWHSSTVGRYVRLEKASLVQILTAVLATLALIPAGNFIADQLVRQLHVPQRLVEINAEIFTSRSPAELLWLVFVVCITPALCEETFFRGVVQRTFERTIGWKSAILVGVLFGLFHVNPLGLLTLSVLGMVFGYFYYRSKSLFPSMAAHFTNNLVVILTLYKSNSGESLASVDHIPLWLVGVTLPVGIGFLILFGKITSTNFPHKS